MTNEMPYQDIVDGAAIVLTAAGAILSLVVVAREQRKKKADRASLLLLLSVGAASLGACLGLTSTMYQLEYVNKLVANIVLALVILIGAAGAILTVGYRKDSEPEQAETANSAKG